MEWVTAVLPPIIFSSVSPWFGVPFLVHLETRETSRVEPFILWAICSKPIKTKNNWISDPLCHGKWSLSAILCGVMVNRTNLITWCRCYLSGSIRNWRRDWSPVLPPFEERVVFSYRKDNWRKYIDGLTTNHQMNWMPLKFWHLLYIPQKGWEYNRQFEITIWYAGDEEEFSHWKVKQVLDVCVFEEWAPEWYFIWQVIPAVGEVKMERGRS